MTISELKSIYSPDRPLLLIDADEVLLKFVERLTIHLETLGYSLKMESFQLSGNIRHMVSGEVAKPSDVKEFISSFFDNCVHDVAAVDGAAECLSTLSEHYQIAILSNVPERCRQGRADNLKSHGMDYPVLSNAGGKGPAVAELLSWSSSETIFIDDLPPQHASVAEHAPLSHRIHTVADPHLASLIETAEHAHIRIDAWPEIKQYLLDRLKDEPARK